jgi:hypothetical protein
VSAAALQWMVQPWPALSSHPSPDAHRRAYLAPGDRAHHLKQEEAQTWEDIVE